MENKNKLNETFWQQNHAVQSVISWKGFAFEIICFNYISQIKQALEIGGISATYSAWSKKADDAEL